MTKPTNMEAKAFVLLSGGLDSTTTLYKAIYDYGEIVGESKTDIRTRIEYNTSAPNVEDVDPIDWVEAISIDYGQRHSKETKFADQTCAMLGIKHTTLNVSTLLSDKNTMLTQADIKIPSVDYADLPAGVSPTYVPFRNGTMLSIITAHAQKWINAQNAEYNSVLHPNKPQAGVYFGAHAEDAMNWAYPDCTPEFIGAMANAIYIGSYQQIRLHAPLQHMLKSDIVTLGDKLDVDFVNTWSCYAGGAQHCGVCPTCRSRRNAFIAANVYDPTIYAAGITT